MEVVETDPIVVLSVKVPASLRDAINALAEQNERTQAAEIRVALRKHVSDSPTR